ncbi:hypothetical protein QO005_003047 [Rhizobium paknamense]|uniref:Uncharacterized protein n=1 Tax=Rhizobium paknamense TaxID=1206817 RepID=A0ABU0IEP2_9HYPH|nr:hypothetical protein [Rhizobium paknamense]
MAILAMDSYNRGYDAGLGGTDGLGSTAGKKIGTAQITYASDSGIGSAERAAGFYAVAYEWNGQTVISYRGTDNAAWLSPADPQSDVWGGYGVALGNSYTNQSRLAVEFYQAVTGTQTGDPASPDVVLTGHSMGAGFAGLIASLYGQQAFLYDNMTFEWAAQSAYFFATNPNFLQDPDGPAKLILKDFYNDMTPWAPLISNNLNAFAVTGEILGVLRTAEAQATAVEYLDSNGGIRDPLYKLHSQALLVSLQFAKDEQHVQWASVGKELWDAAFDQDVGRSAGFTDVGNAGRYDAASKLMTAIAYSALDSGSASADAGYGYVFGNTGIRAMFDDADELGSVVSAGKASEALSDAMPGLLQAVVQFAGLMAKRGINYRDFQGEGQPFDPLEGIIALSDADGNLTNSASSAVVLKLTVNQDLWKLGAAAGSADLEILGLGTLVEDLLDQSRGGINEKTIRAVMAQLYGAGEADFAVTKAIGSVEFALNAGPLSQTLPEVDGVFDSSHTSLFAATDSADTIHGNAQNNMIAGSDGDDTLYGHLGSDLLLGGNGSDLFIDSVTERSETDGRQNENDVYIGSEAYEDVSINFKQWLVNPTETDVVRYTVDQFTHDDPATPANEAAVHSRVKYEPDYYICPTLGSQSPVFARYPIRTNRAGTHRDRLAAPGQKRESAARCVQRAGRNWPQRDCLTIARRCVHQARVH